MLFDCLLGSVQINERIHLLGMYLMGRHEALLVAWKGLAEEIRANFSNESTEMRPWVDHVLHTSLTFFGFSSRGEKKAAFSALLLA